MTVWLIPATMLLVAGPASSQTITTLAGNGSASFAGDGGSAGSAALNHPRGIAISSSGTIYISDVDNYRIRRVGPNSVITTFAGNGAFGSSGDGGPALNASFSDVMGLAIDGAGNLYVADAGNRRIRKITTGGIVTTFAGTGQQGFSGDGGAAVNAMLNRPTSIAFDASGNLYISDSSNQRIRRVAADGTITTFAGNGTEGFSGDGGLAVSASMDFPLGLAADRAGNIYFADANNNRIRKISASGVITTAVGNGQGTFGGDGGPAFLASINIPSDVVVDLAGNLYIADSGNNRIRKVDTNGIITTVAGTGVDGYSGDGGPASQAMLNFPWGVATDAAGGVYVADRLNNRVRTLAGSVVVSAPTLQSDGTVNGATFLRNVAIAPGGIVTLFGSNFASLPATASGAPYPLLLGETSVTFNGIPAPLFYVSPGQINAQAPFEVLAGLATVVVKRGATASSPTVVNVAPFSPGIFIMDQVTSQGAILHANFSLVSSTNPARAGETLAIYATGLGPLQGVVRTGDPAPVAITTTLPVVHIGAFLANVAYSGTAPGFAGLYQVNVVVPPGLSLGTQPVQITMNGMASNVATVAIGQ
jgi:uncharacterized protein (TIGR03437 family)